MSQDIAYDEDNLYVTFLREEEMNGTEPEAVPLTWFLDSETLSSLQDQNEDKWNEYDAAAGNDADFPVSDDQLDEIPWQEWGKHFTISEDAIYAARLRRNAFVTWFEVYADMIEGSPEIFLDDIYPESRYSLDEKELAEKSASALIDMQYRLKNGDMTPARTTADEMLLYFIGCMSQEVAPDYGVSPAWVNPSDLLLEDLDFLLLFDSGLEGIENSAIAAGMGMTITGPDRWFEPFRA